MRIKGLAASFHADALMELAEEALTSAPGDPIPVRKIKSFLDEYAA